jgi:VIT1/CCC1 family predicted Fe2+/Mn2+ transporter
LKTYRHPEGHATDRVGWLRAAVLGANDGMLSTSSLIIGVASGSSNHGAILLAGSAALFSGALAMAAGEYVSVSSQRDAEQADLRREGDELRLDPLAEERELAAIYVGRGLDEGLAMQVARQLMAGDPLAAHARDELGLAEQTRARPMQAALASAAAFALGAAPPLLAAAVIPLAALVASIAAIALVALAALGATGAKIGGAPINSAVMRVMFWGALAMLVTAGLGRLLGTVI